VKAKPTATAPVPRLKLRLPLQVIGALILVVGFALASRVWHAQEPEPFSAQDQLNDPSAPLAISDSRKQSRNVEIYYGKTGLLMEKWSERLDPWMHGKRLAVIIAVISLGAATGCFFLSVRLPE
jgi:hypothetical protein